MNKATLQLNSTATLEMEQRRAEDAQPAAANELRLLEDVELALVGGGDGTPCW
jgi:hypothetical protein